MTPVNSPSRPQSWGLFNMLGWALLTLYLGVHGPVAKAIPPLEKNAGLSQRLNSQVPLDLVFTDEQAQRVRLSQLTAGKPSILALAYYRCPNLCTMIINGILDGVKPMSFTAGREYQIIIVSIDPHETPELAKAKKASYLKRYARPTGASGWHFLTGDEAAIARLAAAVGYRYTYDATTKEYRHPAAISILTPSGRLSRYFYGVDFPTRDLRLSLVEASAGQIATPTDQFLLLCLHYDPKTGRYGPAVLNIVRAGGGLCVVLLVTMLVCLMRTAKPKDVEGQNL